MHSFDWTTAIRSAVPATISGMLFILADPLEDAEAEPVGAEAVTSSYVVVPAWPEEDGGAYQLQFEYPDTFRRTAFHNLFPMRSTCSELQRSHRDRFDISPENDLVLELSNALGGAIMRAVSGGAFRLGIPELEWTPRGMNWHRHATARVTFESESGRIAVSVSTTHIHQRKEYPTWQHARH